MENIIIRKGKIFYWFLLLITFFMYLIAIGCDPQDPVEPDEDNPSDSDTIIVGGQGTTEPYIKGTFIDFWNKENWNASQWDAHMREMKEIGINLLFIQFTAYNEIIWCDSPNDYSTEIHKDALKNLLNSAEKNEMHVFVGLYFNENYWDNASNPTEMSLHAQRSNALADDIWFVAQHYKSFAGWYISHEAAPYHYDTQEKFSVLKNNLINPIAGHCRTISNKPVTTTVFMNHNLTTPEDFRLFMQRMSTCGLDMIMLQDGIGVGHADLNDIESYFKAGNDGLFTDGNFKGAFWADIENFTTEDKPVSIDVLKQKLSIASKQVRNIVIFQYYQYMSPTGKNGADAKKLRDDYLNYLP